MALATLLLWPLPTAEAVGSTPAVTVVFNDQALTVQQFTATRATATCPAGTILVGGGDELTWAEGAARNDGSVTLGVYPSGFSSAPNPASWTATGGYSAVTEDNVVVNAYALCASGVAAGTVVETLGKSTLGPVTAVCPAGTSLVGGGGGYSGFVEASPTDTNNTKLFDSYPSDPGGDVPDDGSTNPTAWTVFGNSNQSSPLPLSAFAVCATGISWNTEVVVRGNTLPSPVQSGAPALATANCPPNSLLLGGGILLNDNPSGVGTGGQGVHVIGDFPSTDIGTPVSTGTAGSWTAIGEDGGQQLTQLATDAIALCVESTATPAAQSISFAPPAQGSVGSGATLAATGGGSGNPVTFRVDPASGAGVCSLNGATVSYAAAGSCVIDANQAGNADFQDAPQVSRTITVTNAPPPPTSSTTTTSLPTPSAPGTGSSGLPGGPSPAQPSTGSPLATHPTGTTATPSTSSPSPTSTDPRATPTTTTVPASVGASGAPGSPVGPGFTGGRGSFGTPISGLLILSAKPAASPPVGTPTGGGTTRKVLVVPHHRSQEGLWITLALLAVLAGGIFLELRQSPRLARFTNPELRSPADGH